jgi:hypothetical protein
MLIPLARMAMSLGHSVDFLALTTAGSALAKTGIAYSGFADFWRYAGADARRYGEELYQQLPAGGLVPPEESKAYLGISFADLVEATGEEQAHRAFGEHGRHAFLPVAFMTRVLRALRPDVVIATNSPRAERAAIVASGQLGIPSVCAVDLFALQEVRWIGVPGYADKVCVLNDQVRQMFLRHGRKEQEVVVTGNPAFDRLHDPAAVGAGTELRHHKGWDDDMTTLLWASQIEPAQHPFNGEPGDPSLPRQVERELRSFVRSHGGFRLVVRYHPSERETFVAEEGVEFSPPQEPLAALLHAVDVVVITASTVGVEAALLGRPVISVDRSVLTQDAPYAEMGISHGVKRLEDLPDALLQAARKSRESRVHRSRPAGADPSATERVMREIESLL